MLVAPKMLNFVHSSRGLHAIALTHDNRNKEPYKQCNEMSARAAYLSKYMSGGDVKLEKKKKKKSTKKKSEAASTPIIVNGRGGIDPIVPNGPECNDADDEDSPILLEMSKAPANRGFKRIDNGEILPPPSQQTVYRDSSGRIVNLQDEKARLETEQSAQEAEQKKATERVNTGELDMAKKALDDARLERAKRFDYSKSDEEVVEHMKAKQNIDDPLFNFGASVPSESLSALPTYTDGLHPQNRFKIKAGHFWDGIDRSNGFEARLVAAREGERVKRIETAGTKESYTEYDFE